MQDMLSSKIKTTEALRETLQNFFKSRRDVCKLFLSQSQSGSRFQMILESQKNISSLKDRRAKVVPS